MNADELIKKTEYDFLRTNPDLQNVIYLTLSGSYGYGTNTENSDFDLRGVLIEDKKYLLGLKSFEQFEDLQTDTVIYGLKKFVRLCINANPSALELLGTEDDCTAVMTEKGKLLRENSGLFLTRRVISSFGNYALAQLRRMQNALSHDSCTESEKLRHVQNSLNAQLEHIRRSYSSFDGGSAEIYSSGGELKLDITLKNYPLRDFTGICSELSNTVRTYNKLSGRNSRKDEAHLNKHAMHLIRLLITGTDILNGKGIISKRRDEHDFLMDLRSGRYSYEEIFRFADDYQAKFREAAENTKLPQEPNTEKIEDFLISIY